MKSIPSPACLALILVVSGCATQTDQPPTPEQAFQRADIDGDGRISRAEFDAYMIGEMFRRYDTNGDDSISEKEFLDGGGTAETFRRINTSGSGGISMAEAKASRQVRSLMDAPFKEADLDRSGQVTLQEFQTARARALDYVR